MLHQCQVPLGLCEPLGVQLVHRPVMFFGSQGLEEMAIRCGSEAECLQVEGKGHVGGLQGRCRLAPMVAAAYRVGARRVGFTGCLLYTLDAGDDLTAGALVGPPTLTKSITR